MAVHDRTRLTGPLILLPKRPAGSGGVFVINRKGDGTDGTVGNSRLRRHRPADGRGDSRGEGRPSGGGSGPGQGEGGGLRRPVRRGQSLWVVRGAGGGQGGGRRLCGDHPPRPRGGCRAVPAGGQGRAV